ncbi:HAD family hydrolase [Marasmitruncus massiliensis]|uniref:HAD family hydrolase n=1 Tax=Marasmitruncus massiliensis TaxID=1944642 RepID=UPI000C7D7598|nr:HAD family hydrolase [Marasmitruncus massiliensis]
MPKLLALDLDGTTFSHGTHMPEKNLLRLREAKERGTVICFVTGRKSMEPLRHLFDLTDYFVMNNGGRVVKMPGERVLFNKMVSAETADLLITFCNQNGVALNITTSSYWGINLPSARSESITRATGKKPECYRFRWELPFEEIDGFVACENYQLAIDYIREAGLDLYCAESEPGTVDIMPGGVNKWLATKWIADSLGIAAEDIVSAGNYRNDIELIAGAGVGVAVQNAPNDVKSHADYITQRSNCEGAVAELIEKFILCDMFRGNCETI